MRYTCRPYQSEAEDDFWRMRDLLRQTFLLNGRRTHSWHVARLDYARWHSLLNCAKVPLQDVAFVWEDAGQLIALLMPDGGVGEAHFAIHPLWRAPELERDMLAVAEERLASKTSAGPRQLYVWAPEHDTLRQAVLVERGYVRADGAESTWYRDLTTPVAAVPVAPGYVIRSLGDGLELLERCYASGLGFHDGDITCAVDNRNDPTWYRNIQTAALYRRDLDLVAVAPDGAIAAFCTLWFDDVTRSAYIEPVATIPAHQRRGLARAVLTEGLRRVQRMGATTAIVGGYGPGANALYQAVMGGTPERYESWVREWTD